MKNSYSLFKKLFFSNILLLQLPSFFVILPIFNFNSLGKFILLLIFFYLLLFENDRLIKQIKKFSLFFFIFLILLISQSASIINTLNIFAFLEKYEDFLFGWLIVFPAIVFIEDKEDINIIIKLLFFGLLFNVTLKLLIFFNTSFFIFLGQIFIHPNLFNLIKFNIERSRIYIDSYDEIFLPLLSYFFINTKDIKKYIYFIFIIIILFLSLASNFRIYVLMLFFAITFSLLFTRKEFKNLITFSLFFSFLIFLYVMTINIENINNRLNIFERLFLAGQFKEESYGTIISRLNLWQKSIEISLSYPFFGIGLGNYYDYLPSNRKINFFMSSLRKNEFFQAMRDPHNIFFSLLSETGLFGFISFIILLFYFLIQDTFFSINNVLSKIISIAFWTLFIFSVFNPVLTIKYHSLFWLLRVIKLKLDGFLTSRIEMVKQRF